MKRKVRRIGRVGSKTARDSFPITMPVVTLVAVAVTFLFLADFLLFQKVFFYFDFEVQWIPFHQFAHSALKNGQSLLWNPYLMLGFPQHAESQLGAFYPINAVLHFLPNQAYAVALSIYTHLLIGFAATYLLARAYKLDAIAAIHTAICFTFSGFIFAQFTNYNISLAAVYLPLKLLLITHYFTRDKTRYLLYFALVSGIELLISHANMSFITSVAAGLYFVVLALVTRQGKVKPLVKDLGVYALCSLLAVLLASVQLVPTFEFFTQGERSAGVSYEMATSYSHGFSHYLTSFFPMMFGAGSIGYTSGNSFEELYFFCGTFGILLALFGAVIFVRQGGNKLIAVIGTVGVVGFVLSLGANIPFVDLYRVLVELPGFGLFRCPGRWSVVVALALAVFSGYGLQTFLERLKGKKYLYAPLLIASIALVAPLTMYFLGWKDEGIDRATLWTKIIHPLNVDLAHLSWIDRHLYSVFTTLSPLTYFLCMVTLLIGIALTAKKLPVRYRGPLIVAIGLLDMWLVIKPLNPRMPSDFFAHTPDHIAFLQHHAGLFRTISPDEIPNLMSVNHSAGAFYGIPSVKGYASLRLNSYLMLFDQLYRSDVQDYIGVKYEIRGNGQTGYSVHERTTHFPRAFLLERHMSSENNADAFKSFLVLSGEHRKSYAVITHGSAKQLGIPDMSEPSTGDNANVAPVDITAYGHSRIQMQGHAARPSFLVITDMHYPGWQARINDQEASIVPIHGVFRGIYIREPGPFHVEMVYRPLSFTVGALLSILALLIAGGAWYQLVGRKIDWARRGMQVGDAALRVLRPRTLRKPRRGR